MADEQTPVKKKRTEAETEALLRAYQRIHELSRRELEEATRVIKAQETISQLSSNELDNAYQTIKAQEIVGKLSSNELEEAYRTISAHEQVEALAWKELAALKTELEVFSEKNELERHLYTILDEDVQNAKFILDELLEIQKTGKKTGYADIFKTMINLDFEEHDAEAHYRSITENMLLFSAKMGRNVGFRVAMLDYFININKKVNDPKIIEVKMFEKTMVMAYVDELSGVYNRRYYEISVAREWKRARRHKRSLSLLMIDIDNLKRINDTNGHSSGDKIIRHLGETLKSVCREEDTVCRYGGDEFAVILPETDAKAAVAVANRILKMHDAKTSEFTISIGAASFPEHAECYDDLFDNADKALYTSKEKGKNCITLFSAK